MFSIGGTVGKWQDNRASEHHKYALESTSRRRPFLPSSPRFTLWRSKTQGVRHGLWGVGSCGALYMRFGVVYFAAQQPRPFILRLEQSCACRQKKKLGLPQSAWERPSHHIHNTKATGAPPTLRPCAPHSPPQPPRYKHPQPSSQHVEPTRATRIPLYPSSAPPGQRIRARAGRSPTRKG